MPLLAITARCQQDLDDLDNDDLAAHIIEVFQERRGQNPLSGEEMRGIGGPLMKLHADRPGHSIRAVTWYERSRDICWLLAAGVHDEVYRRVERLAKTNQHLPTGTDYARIEAEAGMHLMWRAVERARNAMEEALRRPGHEVPLVTDPPPRAYLCVDGNWLRVRVVYVENGRRTTTQKQVAALAAAIFGRSDIEISADPSGRAWDSLFLVGPVPAIDTWPPRRFVSRP